jgi:hypothetical protein
LLNFDWRVLRHAHVCEPNIQSVCACISLAVVCASRLEPHLGIVCKLAACMHGSHCTCLGYDHGLVRRVMGQGGCYVTL